jgi:hypothetical protein
MKGERERKGKEIADKISDGSPKNKKPRDRGISLKRFWNDFLRSNCRKPHFYGAEEIKLNSLISRNLPGDSHTINIGIS